jgi:2,4-dienoyl-CoA reductase-like NADH-dependent reductase (Old Yellow Enzyme family)
VPQHQLKSLREYGERGGGKDWTFLSRGFNKRQDAYGCDSLENRSRIVLDIIGEIKRRVGQDFPISILMNGKERDKLSKQIRSFLFFLSNRTQSCAIP